MSLEDRNKKEAIWQGWLTKSPPRKKIEKIWKLRWRRRWFVLRQGELPCQFCLEYYVDPSCTKLKGLIDLDQCEEVDAGLRLVEKYQNIFVVTIPQRVYYLAADTEEDMRAWVNCICRVCGLQDTTPAGNSASSVTTTTTDVQYFNIGKDALNEAPLNTSTETDLTLVNLNLSNNNSIRDVSNNYQNFNTLEKRDYSNRETILCEATLTNNNGLPNVNEYSNWGTIERTQSLRSKNQNSSQHCRTLSLEQTPPKKPDNLKLSGSSGPYIAISECYSGPRLNQYSPKHAISDNESVFTDDEWTHPILPHLQSHSRSHLQSETALNSPQWSSMARYSKPVTLAAPPRPPKRMTPDTPAEPSPFPGTRDNRATLMEEKYDIPRNYQINHNRQGSLFDDPSNISPLDLKNIIASSTPNLLQNEMTGMTGSRTLPRQNWYTNAAPSKVEGTIFRYDFFEGEAPAVNRNLKPKTMSESAAAPASASTSQLMPPPPSVDRKLKPPAAKDQVEHSGKGKGKGKGNATKPLNVTLPDEHTLASFHDDSFILTKTAKSSDDRLQYLDLDHSHVPPLPHIAQASAEAKPPSTKHNHARNGSLGNLSRSGFMTASGSGSLLNGDCPSVAYTTVDFVKTDAFNRIRADSARRNNLRPTK